MAKGSVYEGKTVDEAVRKGLEDLGLSRAEATITVVEEGKGGFLGFGARPFRVSIMRRPGGAVREPEETKERRVSSNRRDDRRGGRGGRDRDRDGGRGKRDEGGKGGRDGGRDSRKEAAPVAAARTDAPRAERPEGRPADARGEGRGERREGRRERGGRDRDRGRDLEDRAPRPAPPVAGPAPVPPVPASAASAPRDGAADDGGEEGHRRRRRGRRGGRGRRRGGSTAPLTEDMANAPVTNGAGTAPMDDADDFVAHESHAAHEPLAESMATAFAAPVPATPAPAPPPAPAPVAAPVAAMSAPRPAAVAEVESYAPRAHSNEPALGTQELAATSKRLTEDLLKAMGFEATVTVAAEGNRVDVTAEVAHDDDLLTGQKGEVRQAMQHLLNRFLNRGEGSRYHLQLEVNDFWARRENELAELARSLAESALAQNAEMVTEYLNSQERRIVHVTLKEDTRVKTYALGTGMIKRVAIAPADFPERTPEEDAG